MKLETTDFIFIDDNQVWSELANAGDSKHQEVLVNEYNVKATELWDNLMEIEMQLVDQLEVNDALSS